MTNDSLNELLPCPFCGGQAEFFVLRGFESYPHRVRCANQKCGTISSDGTAFKNDTYNAKKWEHPRMSNLPEPPIELQDKVAAIIYQWDRIERWDCTYVAYTELSDALKDTLRKLAIAAIATIPTHPTPDRDGLIEKLEAAAHGGELSLIDAIALVRQHGAKQVMGEPPSIGAEEIGSEGAATPSPANQQREMRLLTPEAIEAELSKNSRYLHEPLTGNERKLLRDTLALLRPYLRTTEPVIVKLGAAEALSKAILEAHAKWAAEYQGVGHVG